MLFDPVYCWFPDTHITALATLPSHCFGSADKEADTQGVGYGRTLTQWFY